MNEVKEYQINEAGVSSGLAIPTGFRIRVEHATVHSVQGDPDKDHMLEVQVNTYEDDTYAMPLKNDGLEAQGFSGTTKYYDDPVFDGAANFQDMVSALVRADLDLVYNPANIVEDPA